MKRWGDAHMEFLTLLPDIREMAKTSPSKHSLYASLRKAKKISMSYSYFCRLLLRHSSSFPLEQARRKRQAEQAEKDGVLRGATTPAVKSPSNVPAPGGKGLLVVGRRDDNPVLPADVKEEDWF